MWAWDASSLQKQALPCTQRYLGSEENSYGKDVCLCLYVYVRVLFFFFPKETLEINLKDVSLV